MSCRDSHDWCCDQDIIYFIGDIQYTRCDDAHCCRGLCTDATHWINKSHRLCSAKPRDVVELIGSVINGCSFTAGTTWSLLITQIKAPTSEASEDEPPSFVSLVLKLLRKQQKAQLARTGWKRWKWFFTAACLPWLPRQQQSEQSISASLNTAVLTQSEWSRKEVWVSCWPRPLSLLVAVSPPQCPGWRPSATGDEGRRSLWLRLGHQHGHTVLLRRPGRWSVASHWYRPLA